MSDTTSNAGGTTGRRDRTAARTEAQRAALEAAAALKKLQIALKAADDDIQISPGVKPALRSPTNTMEDLLEAEIDALARYGAAL